MLDILSIFMYYVQWNLFFNFTYFVNIILLCEGIKNIIILNITIIYYFSGRMKILFPKIYRDKPILISSKRKYKN